MATQANVRQSLIKYAIKTKTSCPRAKKYSKTMPANVRLDFPTISIPENQTFKKNI